MNRKAVEVSPPSLVVAIALVLIVLIVLLFIFGSQSGSFRQVITDFWNEIKRDFFPPDDEVKLQTCENSILNRRCGGCPDIEGVIYDERPATLNAKFDAWNCGTGEKCVICIERTS